MASIQEEFTVDLKIVTNDMVSFGRWAFVRDLISSLRYHRCHPPYDTRTCVRVVRLAGRAARKQVILYGFHPNTILLYVQYG